MFTTAIYKPEYVQEVLLAEKARAENDAANSLLWIGLGGCLALVTIGFLSIDYNRSSKLNHLDRLATDVANREFEQVPYTPAAA